MYLAGLQRPESQQRAAAAAHRTLAPCGQPAVEVAPSACAAENAGGHFLRTQWLGLKQNRHCYISETQQQCKQHGVGKVAC